jgi:hypothetical protein
MAKMTALENYFARTELPPSEMHLSSNIPQSFQLEHDALGQSLKVLNILCDHYLASYPKTKAAVSLLVSRNIFFDYGQVAYCKADLERLCSSDCGTVASR